MAVHRSRGKTAVLFSTTMPSLCNLPWCGRGSSEDKGRRPAEKKPLRVVSQVTGLSAPVKTIPTFHTKKRCGVVHYIPCPASRFRYRCRVVAAAGVRKRPEGFWPRRKNDHTKANMPQVCLYLRTQTTHPGDHEMSGTTSRELGEHHVIRR